MPGGGLTSSGDSPISHQITSRLIFDEEPLDPEQQPLRQPLRGQSSRTENRERFQRNQRSAAQGVLQRSYVAFAIMVTVLCSLVGAWIVFHVWGWYVYYWYASKPCDKPLATWLLVTLLLPLLGSCPPKAARLCVMCIHFSALVAGIVLLSQSVTCATTNPELYNFIWWFLVFLSLFWICWTVLPLIFVAVLIYGMMHGWFDELNGARPETIKHVETVRYDPALFAEEGKGDDTKPAPECCVCNEVFNESREIKKTSCGHYFHEECLGKWLKVSTTCPLCRNDVELSVFGGQEGGGGIQVPEAVTSGLRTANAAMREANEVRTLRRLCPDLDEATARAAVQQAGSAERAAAMLVA